MTVAIDSAYTPKELARGYTIDMKRVVLAYLVETIIVVTSLIGAWLFAVQYGHNDTHIMTMMMLAPAAFGVVEFCRVPLALSVRKPSYSLFVKLIIVFGLLGAGFVTIKSISQLGEIMFRPRLNDVVHAGAALNDAKSGVAIVAKQIDDADALILQRKTELSSADQQVHDATEKLSSLPEQKCMPISGVGRNGKFYKSMKCAADTRIAPLEAAIATATANQKVAQAQLDKANTQRNQFDRVAVDNTLRDQTINYREAVMNSQLHSFTAIFYGIDPTGVTDGQIHAFLRLFVFIPAIGAAFAATIIALTAVAKTRPPNDDIDLPDHVGDYVLSPLADSIIRQATADHIATMHASVRRTPQPVAAE
jgi:hypothetical protein